MRSASRLGVGLLTALSLLPSAARAEDLDALWSATFETVFKIIDDEEKDDNVTGFFDQYEYTPNKHATPVAELGISEASFDLFRSDETPVLQFRLLSPTSNLGVSGSDIDQPFLNQRIDLLGRLPSTALDLRYRRLRTDDLRLFPEPSGIGAAYGSQLNDGTAADTRFYNQRTLGSGSLRLRLPESTPGAEDLAALLAPELSLRGSYESRKGRDQLRFNLDGPDTTSAIERWRSAGLHPKQTVGEFGTGLLLAPGGLFTAVVDFDHERFREHQSTVLNSDLGGGVLPSAATVGFIPDTNRSTATLRLHSRLGERAVVNGRVQAARLSQEGDRTPAQDAAGLHRNELRFYSANLAADATIAEDVSANAFFRYDYRDNRLPRNTLLFNPTDGSQVAEFLHGLEQIQAGAELVYRPLPMNLLAVGWRSNWVDRDLDFAEPGTRSIRPENALVAGDTTTHDVYARFRIRPIRALRLTGKLRYRDAPDTGYITELDNVFSGELLATVTFPAKRPVIMSVFGRGQRGENDDFEMLSGNGTVVGREFKRSSWSYGATLSTVPWDDVSVFASFFHQRGTQDYDLVRSNIQRYLSPAALTFAVDAPLDYRSEEINAWVGTQLQVSEKTEVGAAYSFTHVKSGFRADNATSATIQSASFLRGDIHRLESNLGHWLTDGLRVVLGYRLGIFDDDSPQQVGLDSVVSPLSLSTYQHTFTFGVTLTNEIWD
jgi:hypothetical protein